MQILCLLTFVVGNQLTLQCEFSDNKIKGKGTAQPTANERAFSSLRNTSHLRCDFIADTFLIRPPSPPNPFNDNAIVVEAGRTASSGGGGWSWQRTTAATARRTRWQKRDMASVEEDGEGLLPLPVGPPTRKG